MITDSSLMPFATPPVNLPNAAMLTVCQDAESLAATVAERIFKIIQQAIEARGVCRIVLAGGETPRRCYQQLRHLALNWTHIHLYFGDERCLPVGDERRNDSMAQQVLLQYIALPAANVHSIPAQLGAEVAASHYALELAQVIRFDLVLLGMGEDGHTASLFPDNPAMRCDASVVAVFDAPKPPSERVSLSLATLNAAQHKLFLVAGRGKSTALQAIARGEILPAGCVTAAEWFITQDVCV